MKMVNNDKRVLEHFYNLLDKTENKKEVMVDRQNIQYLVNKLVKFFALEHANMRNRERAQERALKIKRQTKEINRLHEKIDALEQSHVDVINEFKEKERNLKKGIGKSSLDILNGNSDALYNVKHTIDILNAFNNIISGLCKLSDEQWVFNAINVNTDTIDQYKNIEKEIGMELHEIAGKLEIMRHLIFAEVIDWHKFNESLKALESESE